MAIMRPTGPEIIRNQEGERIMPSAVFFPGDAGEVQVGTQAKNMAAMGGDVAQFVKRHMGEPGWQFHTSSGATYRAEEVASLILKRIKSDAELALGEPVTDAVVTVPAYFDDSPRTGTRQAGQMAGLNVLRILNEPTAAALAFGLNDASDGLALVYDLGGGTFDVTLMRIAGREFTVIATDGNRTLGGVNFDGRLVDFICQSIVAAGGPDFSDDPDVLTALREKAEAAKRSLTTVDSTKVFLPHAGKSYSAVVSRADFERVTADLLDETRHTTANLLTGAGVAWSDIDHFLLVGGSTFMPMVQRMAEELWGKPIERKVEPNEAVALGAAIAAALASAEAGLGKDGPGASDAVAAVAALFKGEAPIVRDVTSHALGDIAQDKQGNDVNVVVIPANTPIPARGSHIYTTMAERQTRMGVKLTQGADPDPTAVAVVGEGMITIPAYPAGAPFRFDYLYDIDQVVHVEVFDMTADGVNGVKVGECDIDRAANMSDQALSTSIARLAGIDVL